MNVNLLRFKISHFRCEDRCRSQRNDDKQVEAETGNGLRVKFRGRIHGLGFESVSSFFVGIDFRVNEDMKYDAEYFHNAVNPKRSFGFDLL